MASAPVKAAATERGRRTLVQGLAIDVAIAVAVVLLAWLPDADLTAGEAWLALGVAVGKSVLTAVASYVMRLKVTPSTEAVDPPAPSGPLPPGTTVRTTTALIPLDEDQRGRVDGNLVAAIVVAGLLVWLVITVLELALGRA